MKYLVCLVLTITTIIAVSILPACKSTSDPGKTGRVTSAVLSNIGQFAEKAVFDTLTNVATQAAEGKKVDLAYAASQGVFTNLGSITSPEALRKVSDAWTAGKVPQLGTVAAQAYAQADPQTPEDRAKVLTTIGNAINSAAANASNP